VTTHAVHLTTDVDHVTDDQLDDLVDALAPWSGVPSMLDGRLSVQLTIDGPGIGEVSLFAMSRVANTISATLKRSQLGITGLEILDQYEFDRRLEDRPPLDDLIPTAQAAEILGVKRQRVDQLAKSFENFPRPVRRGRVLLWPVPALREFLAEWDRSPGPKRTGHAESPKPS
jgi:predicted DNA-binding transcriptional regulator AlpA